MDMVDWWTVRGSTWGIENFDFKVELRRDDDAATTQDIDSYSAANQIALEDGRWCFVTLAVTPTDDALVDYPHFQQTLKGVEWGELWPADRIDRGDLMGQIEELVGQAVIELLRFGTAVKTSQDSPFRPARLVAPF